MSTSSDATPTSPVITVAAATTPSLFNVNMTNISKLTPNQQTNPEYTLSKRQDSLIYSGFFGAISEPIQPLLSQTVTTAQIGTKLSSLYAMPSRGHIMQLKYQLKQWQKGTHTIDDYIHGIISRFDQLALFGKVVNHEDQVVQIIERLPEEYRNIADQIEGHELPPTITKLHEKLRNHEAKLIATILQTTFPVSAHYVQNKSRGSHHNTRNYTNSPPPPESPNYYQNQNHLSSLQPPIITKLAHTTTNLSSPI